MKTKYGEIKSIYDFFEPEVEAGRYMAHGGDVITGQRKCKICGDEITGTSEKGMHFSTLDGNYKKNLHLLIGKMEEHIELHKTFELLNKP